MSRNPRLPSRFNDFALTDLRRSRSTARPRRWAVRSRAEWARQDNQCDNSALPTNDNVHRGVSGTGRNFDEENRFDPTSVLNFYGGPVEPRQSAARPAEGLTYSAPSASQSRKLLKNDAIESLAKDVLRQVAHTSSTANGPASTPRPAEHPSDWTYAAEMRPPPAPPRIDYDSMNPFRSHEVRNTDLLKVYYRTQYRLKQEASQQQLRMPQGPPIGASKRPIRADPRLRPHVLQDIRINRPHTRLSSSRSNIHHVQPPPPTPIVPPQMGKLMLATQYLNHPQWNPWVTLRRHTLSEINNMKARLSASAESKAAKGKKSNAPKQAGKGGPTAPVEPRTYSTRAANRTPIIEATASKKNKENEQSATIPKKKNQKGKAHAQPKKAAKKRAKRTTKKMPEKAAPADKSVPIGKLTLKRTVASTKEWVVMGPAAASGEGAAPAKKARKQVSRKSTGPKKPKKAGSAFSPLSHATHLPRPLSPIVSSPPPQTPSPVAPCSFSFPSPTPSQTPVSSHPSPVISSPPSPFLRFPPPTPGTSIMGLQYAALDSVSNPELSQVQSKNENSFENFYDFENVKHEIDVSETFIVNCNQIPVKQEPEETTNPTYQMTMPIKIEPTVEDQLDDIDLFFREPQNHQVKVEPESVDSETAIPTERIYEASMQYNEDDSDADTVDLETELRHHAALAALAEEQLAAERKPTCMNITMDTPITIKSEPK